MARSSGALWAIYDGLQSLQSLAQGWGLGPADGRSHQGAWRRGADDRQLDRAGSPARLRGQKKSGDRCVGRSRGGLTTKIHARVDRQGRPLQLLITPGQAHDLTGAEPLLATLTGRTVVITDKAYDADRLRFHIKARGAIANIPNMIRRKKRFRWTKALYRERNHVERFFNKLKQFRRIATRYDKLGANFLAFIQLAAVRISLRLIESAP
jgi:transposase